ncbi:hypothetical protein COCNU_11G001700 [Cocos nucifera]|uniref:Uncharacterized protein n=1 Tax=Cocos nucifera TaxID=13894 RepID=A0A8K0INR5_COCNU|nr:hypothetical protein COCNU_11G001700 [Cocos nucifera]
MVGRAATTRLARSAYAAVRRRYFPHSSLRVLSSPSPPILGRPGFPSRPSVGGRDVIEPPGSIGRWEKGFLCRQFHSTSPSQYSYGSSSQVLLQIIYFAGIGYMIVPEDFVLVFDVGVLLPRKHNDKALVP